ncbi:MAG TPA: tetratricopeptide repeat protein [Pyrinomonadaceae bacterium]|nr:tetratricopeptide repeat protein [Pyrinomonadaceae bacterium]
MKYQRLLLISGATLIVLPGLSALGNGTRGAARTSQESVTSREADELSNSAVKLYQQGKYKEALGPAKRALEIRERTLAADDNLVLEAVGNLAAINVALRKYKEAEELYKRVLAGREKRGGAESIEVAETLSIIARLHRAKGSVIQAEAELIRALAIKEKVIGANSPHVAQTLFQLAELYQSQGNLEKAHPLYQRLMSFDDKLVVEADTTVEDARYRFQCLLQKMKKHDEARELFHRSKPDVEPEGPVRINEGGILNGRAIRLQRPQLSEQAWAAGASGTVVVVVTITDEGKVIRACAMNGNPLLWDAAERAARASEFAPTILRGKPVKVTGVISYNFVR